MTLGEISEFKRGTSITRKNVEAGQIPVVAGGRQPAYYHGKSNRNGETIVIAGSGAHAGYVTYWNQPIFVSDAFSIKPDNRIVQTKYVFHFLKSRQNDLFQQKQKGGGVPHIYVKNVAPMCIPIPTLNEQLRIVQILDTFDALVNDLSIGLPAEILARRKQYSYYRDHLLTFKEAA